ncbi:MAG: hypothetical protein MHPSP_001014, partial [Paramarteilia canceri]
SKMEDSASISSFSTTTVESCSIESFHTERDDPKDIEKENNATPDSKRTKTLLKSPTKLPSPIRTTIFGSGENKYKKRKLLKDRDSLIFKFCRTIEYSKSKATLRQHFGTEITGTSLKMQIESMESNAILKLCKCIEEKSQKWYICLVSGIYRANFDKVTEKINFYVLEPLYYYLW